MTDLKSLELNVLQGAFIPDHLDEMVDILKVNNKIEIDINNIEEHLYYENHPKNEDNLVGCVFNSIRVNGSNTNGWKIMPGLGRFRGKFPTAEGQSLLHTRHSVLNLIVCLLSVISFVFFTLTCLYNLELINFSIKDFLPNYKTINDIMFFIFIIVIARFTIAVMLGTKRFRNAARGDFFNIFETLYGIAFGISFGIRISFFNNSKNPVWEYIALGFFAVGIVLCFFEIKEFIFLFHRRKYIIFYNKLYLFRSFDAYAQEAKQKLDILLSYYGGIINETESYWVEKRNEAIKKAERLCNLTKPVITDRRPPKEAKALYAVYELPDRLTHKTTGESWLKLDFNTWRNQTTGDIIEINMVYDRVNGVWITDKGEFRS